MLYYFYKNKEDNMDKSEKKSGKGLKVLAVLLLIISFGLIGSGVYLKFMNDNKLFINNGKLCIDIFDNHKKNKITKKLEQVFLEDAEFNNNYNIYSDNQIESRFLLTPTFMERLKNIQAAFLVFSVNFVFNNAFTRNYCN